MKDTHENNLPLYRIHLIDDMIRSGTYPNKTDLCEKIEVSPRTIARDLDMLCDFHHSKSKQTSSPILIAIIGSCNSDNQSQKPGMFILNSTMSPTPPP